MQNIKCVALGDGAVGKTSLLMSYSYNKFPEEHIPTVFDNYSAEVVIDGVGVSLGLWDTAGQSDFDKMRPLSYPGTDIYLLCFALNSRSSFEHIKTKWLTEISYHSPDVSYILVGTKLDTRTQFETTKDFISLPEGESLRLDIKAIKYMECSARTQQGLKNVFDEAMRIVLASRAKAPKKRKMCIIL